jgi:hypothetical protein
MLDDRDMQDPYAGIDTADEPGPDAIDISPFLEALFGSTEGWGEEEFMAAVMFLEENGDMVEQALQAYLAEAQNAPLAALL